MIQVEKAYNTHSYPKLLNEAYDGLTTFAISWTYTCASGSLIYLPTNGPKMLVSTFKLNDSFDRHLINMKYTQILLTLKMFLCIEMNHESIHAIGI